VAEPFIGSEAVATGDVLKSALRTKYTKLFRDVYVDRGTEVTAQVLARAGWLWSGRRGIIAGLSASAVYGAKWIDAAGPLEIIDSNRNPVPGLRIRSNRIEEDEFQLVDGIPVTTPARTVLDLACWYSTFDAVAAIDALARATEVKTPGVRTLMQRYKARRGIRRAERALDLMDPGAQSPKETWLRLLLIDAGFPRPQRQIPVRDQFGDVIAYLDMGWEYLKVAVEYDGDQHRSDRRQYRWDIRRLEMLERLGWIVVRVTAGDPPEDIVRRVRAALARRTARHGRSGSSSVTPA
jgi:very-short-patch-repair endonuclease